MFHVKKYIGLITAILASALVPGSLRAVPPAMIAHQGRLLVEGVNFTGEGKFKFALVDAAGATTFWSNDGTSVGGEMPAQAVTLNLDKGYYSVMLGDTSLANMAPLGPSMIGASDVRLRVWFSTGADDYEQLTPDQRLASVPYAMIASGVADGAITSASISSDPQAKAELRESLGAAAADLTNAEAQQTMRTLANSYALNSGLAPAAGVPVANRLMFPNQGLYSANAPTLTYRSSHVVQRAGSVLRLIWINQSYNGTASNPFTLTASIQVAATQVSNLGATSLTRIRFGGQDSVVVPPNGYAVSDPVFIKYEPGNVLFVRTCCASSAASNNWPVGMFLNRGNEGVASGDQTQGAAVFSHSGVAYAPQLICGPSPDGKWVYATGDSILDGAADPSNNRGFFDLWQLATNTPGSRSAHPGETAGIAASRFASARIIMALGATHALNTYGTNDIGQGADLPALQASWISCWRDYALNGISAYQATILPRATSSDNWITAANQTPWALDAIRIAANDWLRAKAPCLPVGNTYVAAAIGAPGAVSCPYLTGVVDIAAAVEVNAANMPAQNGGRWLAGESLRIARITGGGASSIIDSEANFNGLARPVAGCLVRITAGTGAGQVNWIVGAQTNTQINLMNSFSPALDVTSVYEIIDTPTRDGVHPLANRHYSIASYLTSNFKL